MVTTWNLNKNLKREEKSVSKKKRTTKTKQHWASSLLKKLRKIKSLLSLSVKNERDIKEDFKKEIPSALNLKKIDSGQWKWQK